MTDPDARSGRTRRAVEWRKTVIKIKSRMSEEKRGEREERRRERREEREEGRAQ